MNVLDIVAGTDEAAFSVDHDGRIGAWNAAMTKLIGLESGEVLGKLCHKVICGEDPFGNRYCGENCPVQRMARRKEPIHRFKIRLQTAQCQRILASVSIIALPRANRSKYDLVHLLTPAATSSCRAHSPSSTKAKVSVPASRTATNQRLTRRELEVLRLLAAGKGTAEIAELLFISSHTVRNHIQNILGKLRVHGRLEAVSLARRLGMI